MSLQADFTKALNKYCVKTEMVYYRRWTPEWTINDFAEGLIEIIDINKTKLPDDRLRGLIAGLVQILQPYPECCEFVNELKTFIKADTKPDPETMLKIGRRYREKFSFIPPVETEAAIVMQYNSDQPTYMRLTMDMVDKCTKRLNDLTTDDLTYANFISELRNLGEERQYIAQLCSHNYADLFGVPRWEPLDSGQITTSLAASNYVSLGIQCLAGRKADRSPGAGSEQYFITVNQQQVPITKLSWDEKDEAVRLEHTPAQYLDPILHEAFAYWKKAMQPNCSPQDLIRAIAAMEYLLQHGMPFKRGSAAIVTAFSYALYKKHGYEMVPAKANTAIYYNALATRSLEAFVNSYETSFVVSPTAIRAQTQKDVFTPQLLTPQKLDSLRQMLAHIELQVSSSSTTPMYQVTTQANLIKLKLRIDAQDAIYDKDLAADLQQYCQNEQAPFAVIIRQTLVWNYDRDRAKDVVILRDSDHNNSARAV
jgi:hypothetical protein